MNPNPIIGFLAQLAERLGIKEEYTEGNTEEDWIEKMFYVSELSQLYHF